jgi:Predicted metal-dependent phosphoesterases (PHP family)
MLRADLHVHSYHSGHAGHLRILRARDCYSDPVTVYLTAKARGMDIVTITDHDSIDGCLEVLSRRPDANDFIMSEEIECRFPDSDLKVHIGAYGIDERIHRDVQPLRGSVFEVAAYLRSHDIFCSFNHPFFFFSEQIPLETYVEAVRALCPAIEVRNGTMLEAHNQLAASLAGATTARQRVPLVGIGGSDAHTLGRIGTTYTEAPGANREEFLASLKAGVARVGGRHGSVLREAREIYGVVAMYWASLLGHGRQSLSWRRRAFGIAFSAVSMPFEFMPLAVAVVHKRGEARRVAAYSRQWQSIAAMPQPSSCRDVDARRCAELIS